jgi:hypothetical protein
MLSEEKSSKKIICSPGTKSYLLVWEKLKVARQPLMNVNRIFFI